MIQPPYGWYVLQLIMHIRLLSPTWHSMTYAENIFRCKFIHSRTYFTQSWATFTIKMPHWYHWWLCFVCETNAFKRILHQIVLNVHGTLCNIGSYEIILKSYYNFFFKIFKLHNICQKITRINLTKDKKVSNWYYRNCFIIVMYVKYFDLECVYLSNTHATWHALVIDVWKRLKFKLNHRNAVPPLKLKDKTINQSINQLINFKTVMVVSVRNGVVLWNLPGKYWLIYYKRTISFFHGKTDSYIFQ